MPSSKFIQIEIGSGALITALDDQGRVWIFNHNTQVWDGLPEKRNENGGTKSKLTPIVKG